ncbi:hypothetical protein NU195Hw_g9396t1 [Hortaea werneckii]
MDHGPPEPSTLIHNRRQCMDAADGHGNDFCTRHDDEFNDPCRTYTLDKTVGFWLRIPCKGQPGVNNWGRFRCGHSGCNVARANQLDIRLHWMENHLPQLLSGERPGNEESGTEAADGDEEYEE